ncbi:outer membrane protein assembly factor [Marinilabilia sp.]|uniref:BamA/OMP85 family outer membrane protein n=1 Tax=Marinilabilia sp. TaxID=2021252 RepID=UPI0025C6BE4F|nr:BamA/TamA family outer membrane protein [Marinilabilia sp.]
MWNLGLSDNLKWNIFKLVFPVLFLCVVFSGYSQENAEIRKLKIRGNKAFDNGELLEKISFNKASWIGKLFFKQQPSYYSAEAWEMNKAQLKAFYQSEGYLHVQIKEPELEIRPRKYKVDLLIRIVEREPVTVGDVDFFTFAAGKEDSILMDGAWLREKKTLKTTEGKRFRDENVSGDQEAIASWFSSLGFAYVDVQPEISLSRDTMKAAVDWNIEKGPSCRFGELTIEGLERTPEKAIIKQMTIAAGDVYSSGQLAQSQKQIYELGLFRIASLQAGLTNRELETIPLKLTLEEAPRWTTRFGLGYGREDEFRTFVNVGYLNFPGPTMRSNFYAKHSALEPYRFEAKITKPSILGPRSSLELKPMVRRRKERGFESFIWGGDLSLHQNFSDYLTGSVSLYFERVDIEITSDFERSLRDLNQSTYSKNGVSLGLLYYTANPRFDPTDGWSLGVNTRANSSLFDSAYPFFKYLFEVKRYQPVRSGLVLAMRLKVGSIRPWGGGTVTPFEERFFAGGSQSVRGWPRQMLGPLDRDEIPIGGNSVLEGSVEPRIKIFGPVGMVLFLDYGNVWRDANTFKFDEIRFAAGTGVRVSTPIGPVGIDFARPVFGDTGKWQFHLNIGHAF